MKTKNEIELFSFIKEVTSWTKDNIMIVQEIKSPLLDKPLIMKDTFILKKFVGGELESNDKIVQLMFACEFNIVRTLSNVEKLSYIEENHEYIIHSHNNKHNIISHIINLSKGGVFHDENHG